MPASPETYVVDVPVSTLWRAPDAPRAVDAAIVADDPDVVAWLAELDAHQSDDAAHNATRTTGGDSRLGLHGRVDSQVLCGEPVLRLPAREGDPDGWVRVVCPWQPCEDDPRGYPGWLPAAHVVPAPVTDDWRQPEPLSPDELAALPADPSAPDSFASAVLALARTHLDVPYLWGGTCPQGLDCSGLVHLVARTLGVVVPRDAGDQLADFERVDLDAVRPGDLYFFASADDGEPAAGLDGSPQGDEQLIASITHVGIVTGDDRAVERTMIHAYERPFGKVTEEPLGPRRMAALVAAARIPRPATWVTREQR